MVKGSLPIFSLIKFATSRTFFCHIFASQVNVCQAASTMPFQVSTAHLGNAAPASLNCSNVPFCVSPVVSVVSTSGLTGHINHSSHFCTVSVPQKLMSRHKAF